MRWFPGIVAAFGVGVLPAIAGADDVLVLSSDSPEQDGAVASVLQAAGHAVTIGPAYNDLGAGYDLSGFDAVFLQPNANWGVGDMPAPAQQNLLAFIDAGGGLVTCEWAMWMSAVQFAFQGLVPALPTTYGGFGTFDETTYTRVTPDAILNAGLPNAITFPASYYSGSESSLFAKPGAAVYYASSTANDGVVGWGVGDGRVLSFSGVVGLESLADENFGTLLANAMHWAGQGELTCVADCNANGSLNILDFVCFQQLFQSGDASADVNGDGALNILDFVAFQQAFQLGCS